MNRFKIRTHADRQFQITASAVMSMHALTLGVAAMS